ncbi:hypothetical protein E2C01_056632 [Portunus trituberculatus]|uniref:Uncharacterized protein n=1 Tax=Portunus trituberculatus TaxID=210409 RepID=A0A5B7H134_PORTR|nr:hypothetical protein [Portunus trituberculatus]
MTLLRASDRCRNVSQVGERASSELRTTTAYVHPTLRAPVLPLLALHWRRGDKQTVEEKGKEEKEEQKE